MSAHILSLAEIAALAAQSLAQSRRLGKPGRRACGRRVAAAERDGLRSHGLMYPPADLLRASHLRQGRRAGATGPIASGAGKPCRRCAFGLRPCRHRPWSARAAGRPPPWPMASPSLAIRNSYSIAACWAITHGAPRRRRAWSRSASPTARRLDRALGRSEGGARHQSPGRSPSLTAMAARASSLTRAPGVVAKSEVMKCHARAGEPIPEGWSVRRGKADHRPRGEH